MTKQTIDLINKFYEELNPINIPGIIIGMQEEDDVSNKVPFGGSFRVMRNICAHEPSTLVTYLSDAEHRDYTTHTLQTAIGVCYLCMYQFLTIMYHMYVSTGNSAYLNFAQGFAKLMLPTRYAAKRIFIMPGVIDCTSGSRLSTFVTIQMVSSKISGRMMEYNVKDSRQREMYATNQRLFWKLVLPDITDFLLAGISRNGTVHDMSIYKYLVNIVLLRDTTDAVLFT